MHVSRVAAVNRLLATDVRGLRTVYLWTLICNQLLDAIHGRQIPATCCTNFSHPFQSLLKVIFYSVTCAQQTRDNSSHLCRCNFINRMLYKNSCWYYSRFYLKNGKMVNGSRFYRALESVSIASALSTALTIYPKTSASLYALKPSGAMDWMAMPYGVSRELPLLLSCYMPVPSGADS